LNTWIDDVTKDKFGIHPAETGLCLEAAPRTNGQDKSKSLKQKNQRLFSIAFVST